MITSPGNPLVKELVGLRSRRHRERSGLFVIEGRRPLELAVRAGVEIQHQVVAPELGGEPIPAGGPVVEMAEVPFRKAAMSHNPDGVLALARHLDTTADRLPSSPQLLLVVEGIEKPGNLGAMLRTADAAGVDGLIVTDPATDIHNPNVVRNSQGALFTVAVARMASGELIGWLPGAAVRLVATTPGEGEPPWETDLTGPVALAVGSEVSGLSRDLLEKAAARVRIPMRGEVDSLNASVTAAVMLFEAVRQRVQT